MSASPIVNAMTIDVEEHFHANVFDGTPVRDIQHTLASRVEASTHRMLQLLDDSGTRATCFVLGAVADSHPALVREIAARGHEIASHGYRWIHYQGVDEGTEREHMRLGMQAIAQMTGTRPLGWYTGRDSPRTRRLVADYGGFAYDSDYYGDDLPFWLQVRKTDGALAPQLVVPYTLDCNDMRFALPQGYSHADPFFQYMKDTFDALYAEGDPAGDNAPKMMSIGMHCRLLGRPGRITALQRFLDHIQRHEQVWVARRIDIARHWQSLFPAPQI